MVKDNIIFSEKNLRDMHSIAQFPISRIVEFGDGTIEQKNYAKVFLMHTSFLFGAIADHIFGYFPYRYMCNKEFVQFYPAYFIKLKENTRNVIESYITEYKNCLNIFDTTDFSGIFPLPKRRIEKEVRLFEFLDELLLNSEELQSLFNAPATVVDPERPKADEIEYMVNYLTSVQDKVKKVGQRLNNLRDTFRCVKTFEVYKSILYYGWEGYKYGSHYDFYNEGDSTVDYEWFVMGDIRETMDICIDSLQAFGPILIMNTPPDFDFTTKLRRVLIKIKSDLEAGAIIVL